MHADILVLPGDGIGPEVTAAAVAVLRTVAARYGHRFSFTEKLIGGAAIDASGEPLPPDTLAAASNADAILLGAVGGPKWSDPKAQVRPEQGLLALRKALGLYANLRPVKPHAAALGASPIKPHLLQGVDLVVVRELTGGIYFGQKQRSADVASDLCEYSVGEIRRVVRHACRLALQRSGRVTSVDKANVLETSRLWREVATQVARDEFPDVTLEHQLVDSMAMHLLARPRAFDVIVTENMFGDILTDEASMLAGSLGLLPSASLGSSGALTHCPIDSACAAGRPAMDGRAGVSASPHSGAKDGGERVMGLYEPIHGSAPDIAGQGIANPYATILSAALLLRHSLGLEAEARCIEQAVSAALDAGHLTADLAAGGPAIGTQAATAAVIAQLQLPCQVAELRD
ncbi:3-isopropylmalate dehydrogenase [Lysobacter solisilvae (ex Woo and Kim 2020)]|uniref:3-isopropylmalate dehydrogenase n=1 Tax=Agrilutibacter terrestris TaxID=2865112 RepID=A0A7H0FZS7_9GAMM|nr:3-isopropylmalate dehydrogenase [Lysobacter terrestris]QNP41543.1 3-isopropylmalate dehydrogenase [Lysobacter terrestris]